MKTALGREKRLLSADQVRAAIKFENPPRPPVASLLPCEEALLREHGEALRQLMARYPDDVASINIHVDYWAAPDDDPNYRWAFGGKSKPQDVPIDNCPVIEDWGELDQFLAEMPSPYKDRPMRQIRRLRRENPDRYVLVSFGHYFNQKLASLRGIENLLFDFHDHADELRTVMNALLEYYRVLAARTAEAGGNGVHGGDDLGTQRSLFMSPQTFRSLFKPYYQALARILHANGLDFWLHTCGNVTELMDELLDCGIDVLHPIQVGAMDAGATVRDYGGRIAFHVGMDVQQLIPFGTVQQVREGIGQRAEMFYRPEGGVIYGAGNVLVAGTPLENIKEYAATVWRFCLDKQSKANVT